MSDPTQASADTPLFRNPVLWTAVFGAIIAAFANAYVAFVNNNASVDIETHKEGEEQLIEAKKAEFTRLFEISKLDVDPAKKKITAFCEMKVLTDPAICDAVLKQKGLGSSTLPTNPQPKTATWVSPWVGGGHNQQEICTNGIAELMKDAQYSGKKISIQFVSEDSRKDFLGHVEYQYRCNYLVAD